MRGAKDLSNTESTKQLSEKDLAVVKKSDEAQEELRSFVDRGSFSDREKSALRINSVAEFQHFWNSAVDTKESFEKSREHGAGLVGRQAWSLAASAYDVLRHVDPMVQLVKDLGAPYGGMAIGTVCFLFTVAKNRQRMEQQIRTTLLQIRDRVPGLTVYRYIYNEQHELDRQIQSKIVLAYDTFITFCIVATKFYSKGRLSRWVKAIWGSTTIKKQASKVQDAIVDVRYTSEELLGKKVDIIKQINLNQVQKIENLEAQLKKFQDGQDGDRVGRIKKMLGLETHSRENDLKLFERYQSEINSDFKFDWANLERMHGSRLESFKRQRAYEAWHSSEQSSMLVLAGYNNESRLSAGQCWLSPVALDLISSLCKPGQTDAYAFYLLGHRNLDLFPQVLSGLALQLLMSNPQALQNEAEYAELCVEIKAYRAASSRKEQEYNDARHLLLRKVVLRVLNIFGPSATVWLVLDRVDQCRSSHRINHCRRLVKELAFLIQEAKVRLRILAVANGYDWRVDEDMKGDDDTLAGVLIQAYHQGMAEQSNIGL